VPCSVERKGTFDHGAGGYLGQQVGRGVGVSARMRAQHDRLPAECRQVLDESQGPLNTARASQRWKMKGDHQHSSQRAFVRNDGRRLHRSVRKRADTLVFDSRGRVAAEVLSKRCSHCAYSELGRPLAAVQGGQVGRWTPGVRDAVCCPEGPTSTFPLRDTCNLGNSFNDRGASCVTWCATRRLESYLAPQEEK
jgi:hypothetical protein